MNKISIDPRKGTGFPKGATISGTNLKVSKLEEKFKFNPEEAIKTSAFGYVEMPHENLGSEKFFAYGIIQAQVKFLQGKVLTVVDASLVGEQKKAVKDLINKMFSEQLSYICQLCYENNKIYTREQIEESGVDIDELEKQAISIG